MAKVGRNQPCVCGSGRKAKRCCGVPRGPGPEQLARVALAEHAQRAALLLWGWDELEFEAAFAEMVALPGRDLSMVVPLPRLWGPVWEPLHRAIQRDDVDGIDAALPGVLAEVDTPLLRLRLAEAALELAERGSLDAELAAVAVMDLSSESTALVASSVVQAAAVTVGAARTPRGCWSRPVGVSWLETAEAAGAGRAARAAG